jgi:hypothetical protein
MLQKLLVEISLQGSRCSVLQLFGGSVTIFTRRAHLHMSTTLLAPQTTKAFVHNSDHQTFLQPIWPQSLYNALCRLLLPFLCLLLRGLSLHHLSIGTCGGSLIVVFVNRRRLLFNLMLHCVVLALLVVVLDFCFVLFTLCFMLAVAAVLWVWLLVLLCCL